MALTVLPTPRKRRLTDAVRLNSTPCQIWKAGSGGRPLQQISFMTLEEDDTSNLLQ